MWWWSRVGWLGSLLGFTVILPVSAGAQGPSFRAQTELVNLNVTGRWGQRPTGRGLTAEQFDVFEDGVVQGLQFFALGEMPLGVVILLDTSSSMAHSLPLVQAAAIRFVTAFRADDRVSVMGISGDLRILQPFTSDNALVVTAIRDARPSGRTPLYAAIYTALRELATARALYDTPRREAMVVLSDGHDTSSGLGFDDLVDSVRRHAVPITPSPHTRR